MSQPSRQQAHEKKMWKGKGRKDGAVIYVLCLWGELWTWSVGKFPFCTLCSCLRTRGHRHSRELQDELLSPGTDTAGLPGLGEPCQAARMDPGERRECVEERKESSAETGGG